MFSDIYAEVSEVHTKKTLVKVLFQLLYSSNSEKVQALKCTQSIKVKSRPLKDISFSLF